MLNSGWYNYSENEILRDVAGNIGLHSPVDTSPISLDYTMSRSRFDDDITPKTSFHSDTFDPEPTNFQNLMDSRFDGHPFSSPAPSRRRLTPCDIFQSSNMCDIPRSRSVCIPHSKEEAGFLCRDSLPGTPDMAEPLDCPEFSSLGEAGRRSTHEATQCSSYGLFDDDLDMALQERGQ